VKPKLALSLTGTRLALEVLRPTAGRGVLGLMRLLMSDGNAASDGAHEVLARIEQALPSGQNAPRPMIEQALSDLKATYSGSLHGLNLEVRLGLDHAQIGVMVLEGVSATSLASSTCDVYTRAWVKQMLHLDPETQVIRWQILVDPHKLLVSCIEQRVFEALNDACQQHGLRFVSCRPAVLSALSDPTTAQGLTIAWTEAIAGAARSNVVQLMRFERKQVSSTWRGWLPSPSGSDDLDNELEGAIRRFQAHHAAAAGEAVNRLRSGEPSYAGRLVHVGIGPAFHAPLLVPSWERRAGLEPS